MLWAFVRTCFLWLPLPLFMLCSLVFTVFIFMFTLRVIKLILDFIPGY